jgi:hypothetical protein
VRRQIWWRSAEFGACELLPGLSTTGVRVRDAHENFTNKGRTSMASSGKKKTTMAKLSRESRLRERRVEKKARKDARKHAAANPPDEELSDTLLDDDQEAVEPELGQPSVEAVVEVLRER